MIIYKITNKLNGKVYIGQTTRTIEQRFRQHIKRAKEGDGRHIYCAMRKYGIENFDVVQIDSANSIEELNSKEEYWIKQYNSIKDGYNMTGGVDNPMNYSEIISKHNKKMRTEEVRNKISKSLSEYRKKNGFSKEHLEKIRKSLIGNKHFEGHKRSEFAKQQTAKALHKSVYCIDKQGNIIHEFESVKDAAIWWYDYDKFTYNSKTYLCNHIKESSVKNIFIRSLKWFYGSPCVETIESITK